MYVQKLVMMTNKKPKRKSRCANFMVIKSFSDKINHKDELETFVSQ